MKMAGSLAVVNLEDGHGRWARR